MNITKMNITKCPTCSWCGKEVPTIFGHGCFYTINGITGSNFEINNNKSIKNIFNTNSVMPVSIVCKPCFSHFEWLLKKLSGEEADEDAI